jgi:hypothetical protein
MASDNDGDPVDAFADAVTAEADVLASMLYKIIKDQEYSVLALGTSIVALARVASLVIRSSPDAIAAANRTFFLEELKRNLGENLGDAAVPE